ncbi:MAG: hypothetical protein ACRBN8_32780 [Nannocystales bacterium]
MSSSKTAHAAVAEEVVVFDHTLRAEGGGMRPPSFHVHCDDNA